MNDRCKGCRKEERESVVSSILRLIFRSRGELKTQTLVRLGCGPLDSIVRRKDCLALLFVHFFVSLVDFNPLSPAHITKQPW